MISSELISGGRYYRALDERQRERLAQAMTSAYQILSALLLVLVVAGLLEHLSELQHQKKDF